MGLFAVITGDDLELPTELSGTAIVPVDSDANGEDDVAWNNETTEVVVEIDYSDAFAAFADTFYSVATDLVPIDTGYLFSTISSSSDDWSITAEADADYAQYVEYGTWKMDAQPYFAPALNQAWDETSYLFEEAINQAQQEYWFWRRVLLRRDSRCNTRRYYSWIDSWIPRHVRFHRWWPHCQSKRHFWWR